MKNMLSNERLYMKCKCGIDKDESERVFGKKAMKQGDMAYCPKHGDVRLATRAEMERCGLLRPRRTR